MPPSKPKKRRLSTTDSEDSADWGVDASTANRGTSSRPRRAAATANERTTIERSSVDVERPTGGGSRLRLTVKAPPGKLREAISGGRGTKTGGNRRDTFVGGEIVSGPRSGRKKAIVEESSEEEEEEDDLDAEGEEDDEDAEGEEEDEEEDAEGEDDDDMDADGDEDDDVDMEDAPPLRPTSGATSRSKAAPPPPRLTVTSAGQKKTTRELPSVEGKEMAMADDDDDELSEIDSPEEMEMEGVEEDAEGEEEEEEEDAEREEIEEDDEEEDSSDEATPASMSRSHTPDLSKLTRRQRAAYEEYDGGLMALSNEAQKKKHLTAEEHAMRRAEMARRRKNLSEKRTEEEKMDTINRLLKKQAPKRRRRAELSEALREEGEEEEDGGAPKPSPIFARYVQRADGTTVLSVPEEWLAEGQPLSTALANAVKPDPALKPVAPRLFGRRMVEEVA